MTSFRKNILLLPLYLLFVLLSCSTNSEEDLICGTSDPLNDLPWLNEIKTFFELRMSPAGAQIISYNYKGENVFWIEDPCCNTENPRATIYNCQGDTVCIFDGAGHSTCPDFREIATDSIMLFNNVN